MSACHIFLERPWLYDRKVLYDGFKHVYSFEKDGQKVTLASLKPSLISKPIKWTVRLLLIEKGDFQELPYMLDHEKYFEEQICYGEHALSWVAPGLGLVDCDLCKGDTCSLFLVGDPY